MKKTIAFLLAAATIFSLINLIRCDSSPKATPSASSEEFTQPQIMGIEAVDDATETKITQECLNVAKSYESLYLASAREPSPYAERDLIIAKNDDAKIVAFLASQGIAVTKPNRDKTDYLLNAQGFETFWQQVQAGKEASFTTYTLSDYSGLYYHCYDFKDSKKRRLEASLAWDANNTPQITNIGSMPLSFWDYTIKGNFLYEEAEISPIWETAGLGMLCIKPCDEQLLDYGQKYVDTVGYSGNNLFLTDWDESDYRNVNFNDLFEYLYFTKNGDYFRGDQYPFVQEIFSRYLPETVFEPIMMSYFAISQENLQALTLYDKSRGGYPWQEPSCSNYCYTPYMTPDVQSYTTNKDGTATLQIEVLCPEEETDCLFTHELTVRNLPDGSFQYVSNKIISSDQEKFPRYYPRIEEQRPKDYRFSQQM